MKHLLGFIFLTLSFSAFSAEDFNLWTNDTFTAPYSNGLIATSPVISNTNGKNSLKIVIDYEAGSPINCDCLITAVIEEEITAGVWITLAAQHEAINTSLNAPQRILIASPQFNANPGLDEFIAIGEGVRISHTNAVAPVNFRVRIYFVQSLGGNTLQSITFSANGRKYDS